MCGGFKRPAARDRRHDEARVCATRQVDPDNTITALDTIQNAAMQFGDLLRGGLTTTNLRQAQPGDAIFFKNIETGTISHVGIVIAVSTSYIKFADEPHSGPNMRARIETMNRAHTRWGKNEVFAGLGRPIEPAPGRSPLAQPTSGLPG